MRPTAKDLAEAAGVSLATVDRVLNDRPNVSKKAARLVTEAIERIGFVRNPAAVNLARSRIYRFRFLLPMAGDQYLRELLEKVDEAREALRSDLTDVDVVQIPTTDPHAVAKYLSGLQSEEVDGIAVMAPESPQVRDAMARLIERGIKVVQFLSGQEKLKTADFVGIDNFAAGATAGKLIGRFLSHEPGKIMVIAETMMAQDSIERRLGFDSIINERFPHLCPLPSAETYGDERRASLVIQRMLEHNPQINAVYVLSAEARLPISTIAQFADLRRLTVVVHERTPFSEEALRDERIDAIIAQNPGHAVRSAIRIMRARLEAREPLASQEKIRIEILLKENL
ncbi:MAG: LacI family DNA-binding transcriptional regulator [Ferrovibrio sp.]|uniref:LacI family DNA-binding transcriptional regulator n=1 Tax=Ciceribacter sichuanensis TaxID=2949647 RepID=A0ABT0VF15_9HYPH|nr:MULTISPECIES: LacI family DNA-binding transcriptional regulator [Alphaproteobacteria]MCM2404062.1 LacI family DNA-binding transcriptional regulator [Ciceribacter sp. S153]MCW0233969.1 LacI family DNA-binding transcriptional regulator [Ferrovibrio sp.]